MFKDEDDAEEKAKKIMEEISNHALTKSHSRHLSAQRCKDIGLKIVDLEADQELQENVLSVHHACIHTLPSTAAFKLIENQNGVAFVQIAKQVVVQT